MIDKSFNASSSTVVENPLKYHIRGCTSGIQYRLWDRTLLFPAALITASASGIWVGVWEGRGNWNWNWNWMLVVNVIVWLWLGLGWVHRLGPRVWLGWMFCEMAVIICLNIFVHEMPKNFLEKGGTCQTQGTIGHRIFKNIDSWTICSFTVIGWHKNTIFS